MKIHFRTVLVSTAALAITGGAAFAYFDATSVSGTGSASTTKLVAGLELFPDPDAPAVSVIPGPGQFTIKAKNTSGVPLSIPAGTTASASAPGCPKENFSVTFSPTTAVILAGATAADAGTITVSLIPSDSVNQSACSGAKLTFVYTVPPTA